MKLNNPKHEAFAQAIAEYQTATQAYKLYVAKGGTTATAMVQGCRLLKDPKVALRVQELRSQASDILEHKIGMSKETMMRILVEIVETAPDDLTRKHRLAERWRKVKGEEHCSMPSKIDALNLLAELAGWKQVTKAQLELSGSLLDFAKGVLDALPQQPGLPQHGEQ